MIASAKNKKVISTIFFPISFLIASILYRVELVGFGMIYLGVQIFGPFFTKKYYIFLALQYFFAGFCFLVRFGFPSPDGYIVFNSIYAGFFIGSLLFLIFLYFSSCILKWAK